MILLCTKTKQQYTSQCSVVLLKSEQSLNWIDAYTPVPDTVSGIYYMQLRFSNLHDLLVHPLIVICTIVS